MCVADTPLTHPWGLGDAHPGRRRSATHISPLLFGAGAIRLWNSSLTQLVH
jgi:hypothetical protein